MSAERVTPHDAAMGLWRYLKKLGYREARVWGPEDFKRTGWTTADAGVVLEGGPDLVDVQMSGKGPFGAGWQPWPGVVAEPYSTWLMCFYREKP